MCLRKYCFYIQNMFEKKFKLQKKTNCSLNSCLGWRSASMPNAVAPSPLTSLVSGAESALRIASGTAGAWSFYNFFNEKHKVFEQFEVKRLENPRNFINFADAWSFYNFFDEKHMVFEQVGVKRLKNTRNFTYFGLAVPQLAICNALSPLTNVSEWRERVADRLSHRPSATRSRHSLTLVSGESVLRIDIVSQCHWHSEVWHWQCQVECHWHVIDVTLLIN